MGAGEKSSPSKKKSGGRGWNGYLMLAGIMAVCAYSIMWVPRLVEIAKQDERRPPHEQSDLIHAKEEGVGKSADVSQVARQLDKVFAGYMIRSSYAAILEDYNVGGVVSETGATNKVVADRILGEIRALYREVCKEGGLHEPIETENFPPEREVVQLKYFDAYSYSQFKVAAKYISKQSERRMLTERVGQRVLLMMQQMTGVKPSGNPEDFAEMQESLEKVLGIFKSVGYVYDSGIIWPEGSTQKWKDTHDITFQYWMADPVILPSARRLFEEEGFAQHFSSRTIENLFAGYMAEAREDENFDPREHDDDHVVEQWTLKTTFI